MENFNFDECLFIKNLSIFINNKDWNDETINYIKQQFKGRNMNIVIRKGTMIISIKDDYLLNYITIPKTDKITNMLAGNLIVQITEKMNKTSPILDHPLGYTQDFM